MVSSTRPSLSRDLCIVEISICVCLFVKMSYVCGGGGGGRGVTFVKREGTTADKLDFALARAHSFEFSSMCSRFYKAVYAGNY